MASKTISGLKAKSPLRGRLEKIKTAGMEFRDLNIITGANSTNAVMQAEAVMTALNITVSHESADFSLVNDPTKQEQLDEAQLMHDATIMLLEPTPIDATDKFRGAAPEAGLVEIDGQLQELKRSSFYEQDEEPSKLQQKSDKAKLPNLQNQIKIAMGKSLSTPTAKVKNSDGTNLPTTSEKYRGIPRRKKVDVI